MSDYALVNLEELPDGAASFGPGIEGRFARTAIGSEHLGVSLFRYAPGFRFTQGHSHREQEEAYVVIEGSGRVRLDDEVVELRQWDVVRVAPAVVRAFEGGPEGMTLVAVASDRPEGGDALNVPGWWPVGDDSSTSPGNAPGADRPAR